MRPKRVCAEKEALHLISSDKDKDIFQKKFINKDKGIACGNLNVFLVMELLLPKTLSQENSCWNMLEDTSLALKEKTYLKTIQMKMQHFYFFTTSKDKPTVKMQKRLGIFINDDHIKPNSKIKITAASSCNEQMEKKSSLENLESEPDVKKIDDLVFNPKTKIADGCNGAKVIPGFFCNCPVAVKRVVKHVENFLGSEKLTMKHF
ncbi:hypothetical protein CCH79_00017639 [Gambusia affinis]|uniref:Uncharacterized protein n=1 Tax=Gambusia affinis TaxID=33528 RepID=A0A315W0H3_GAMAF|nr:hypothetical protein CCH79_00017639 [Gambusia affinis]